MHHFYRYLTNKVRPDLYVLAEQNSPLYEDWGLNFYVNSMQLVIGSKRAVLIDTGYGFGDLMPLIRQLTDLPVTLLITHSSYDHWRGANQFTDIYMSKADQDEIEEMKNQCGVHFKAKDLCDGDIFDLGGITLETIHVPGHTKGSMCFLDRKSNAIYTGDAVNKLPWVFSGRETLDVYYKALLRLREMTPEQPAIYCGHSLDAYPYQVLLDSITACEEVLAGNTNDPAYHSPIGADRLAFKNAFVHEVGDVRLCYSTDYLR